MPARDNIIIFEHPENNRMSLCIPGFDDRARVITDDNEFLDWVREKDVHQRFGVKSHLVLRSDFNSDPNMDRYFRNAWHCGESGERTVDMDECRQIHLAQIRKVRNLELAAKDIPWMKAVEAGDTDAQATIATEKQVLRDIPATFDLTTGVDTPAQLKAKWPTELPARE